MTTKYTYYHTQNVSYVNNGYMPDPVLTAGANTGYEGVLQAIKAGTPYNISKYYQYTKHRFKHRLPTWKFSRVSDGLSTNKLIEEDDIKRLEPTLADKRLLITQEYRTPVLQGAKFFADMQARFGLDEFNTTDAKGNSVVISTLAKADLVLENLKGKDNWIVGNQDKDKYIPVVIIGSDNDVTTLKPSQEYYILSTNGYTPEPSVGIVYQYASQEPTIVEDNLISSKTLIADTRPVEGTHTKPETELFSSIDRNPDEPISIVDDEDISYDADGNEIINTNPTDDTIYEESVVFNYSIIKVGSTKEIIEFDKVSNSWITKYEYIVEDRQVTKLFTYDSEGYIWATDSEESHPNIWSIYYASRRASTEVLWTHLNEHKANFKLYPYLPFRENWIDNLEDTTPEGQPSKVKEVIDALKVQSKVDKKDTLTEPEDKKLDRVNKRATAKKPKTAELSKANRTILRSQAKNRKLKVAENINGFSRKDTRKFVEAGRLLNQDVKILFDSMLSQDGGDKLYQSALAPAVTLDANMDITTKYWYQFFNRLYRKLGDGGYGSFYNAVKAMEDLGKADYSRLPRYELEYETGKLGGFLSFAYIQKFKMKGTIREIKRTRRVSDIRRGKHHQLFWASGLGKQRTTEYDPDFYNLLLEPEKVFANDTYHTTSTGKQYNIGGAETGAKEYTYQDRVCTKQGDSHVCTIETFTKQVKPQLTGIDGEVSKNFVMFNWFGYTFFCMPSGEDEVNVIAVAGLISGTSSGHFNMNTVVPHLTGAKLFASAWKELDLIYQRNVKKYVDKKADKEINVTEEFYKGWSKKYRTSNRIDSFFVVPLDYKTFIRMSGTDRLRFADRAVLMYSWNGQEQKKKSNGWVKVVQVVALVAAVVLAVYTAGASAGLWGTFSGMSAAGASSAVGGIANSVVTFIGVEGTAAVFATTLAVNLAISFGLNELSNELLRGLNKLFGSSGFLAIALAVAAIAAMSFTGVGQNVLASLPYASQVPYTQLIRSASGSLLNEAYNGYMKGIEQDIKNIQKQLEDEQKRFNDASYALSEKQEEFQDRQAKYDITKVLSSLKFKTVNPNNFMNFMVNDNSFLGSYAYLERFLDIKLSLDLESFDERESLDFSLPLNKEIKYI